MTRMFIKKEAKADELGRTLRKVAETGCESITWTDIEFDRDGAKCEAYSSLEGIALVRAGFIPA